MMLTYFLIRISIPVLFGIMSVGFTLYFTKLRCRNGLPMELGIGAVSGLIMALLASTSLLASTIGASVLAFLLLYAVTKIEERL